MIQRILFVCSANKERSKTADDHFSAKFPDLEFDSGGTNHKICNQEGTQPLEEYQVEWADIVLVMEEKHRQFAQQLTKGNYGQKIRVLGIKDVYRYNAPDLIELLEAKAQPLFA